MSELSIIKIVGGVSAGVISFFGLCAWVFPTKKEVSDDCHKCRSGIYEKLNAKASSDDMKRLESKVDSISPQINTLNENVVRLTTIVELKLGGTNNVNSNNANH